MLNITDQALRSLERRKPRRLTMRTAMTRTRNLRRSPQPRARRTPSKTKMRRTRLRQPRRSAAPKPRRSRMKRRRMRQLPPRRSVVGQPRKRLLRKKTAVRKRPLLRPRRLVPAAGPRTHPSTTTAKTRPLPPRRPAARRLRPSKSQ